MRFPRVQFTIRVAMISVAVMAASIWGTQTAFRWRLYRTRAAYHAAEQTKLRAELRPYMEFKKEHGRFPGCGTFQLWLLEDSDRAEWHAILQEKYERASFRPWLPVAPDPPKPE